MQFPSVQESLIALAPGSHASAARWAFCMNFDGHVGFMMELTQKRGLRMFRDGFLFEVQDK